MRLNHYSGLKLRAEILKIVGKYLDLSRYRIFFSRDPVAMDRIGLDILEAKRKERNLDSVRDISTHVAACAAKGLGTDDLARIDLREVKA